MKNALIENIVRLHTTELGVERVKILDKNAVIGRQGKNWYVSVDGCVITVNAGSYTIITAHREK